jgi:hypothetical protein
MRQIFRVCPDCRAERQFEQCHDAPGSCPDSPDGRCPEWACTECGAALIAGMLPRLREPAAVRVVPSKVA